MFDAVGIQFGMDQMAEASSDQISAFTHWYYWSMNIQALAMMCALLFMETCTVQAQVDSLKFAAKYVFFYAFIVLLALQLLATFAATLSLYKLKKQLTIEPTGRNPFTTVYKVLQYMPGSTSALRDAVPSPIYWEEDIPPRIDLGKSKYGGPFTTEEVEDVKTFLLLSL